MTRPDNIPQDAWDIAWRLHGFTEYDEVVARVGSVAELHAAVDHDVALIARAIMAAQAKQCVLIARNVAGEERAVMNLSEPWAIDEFIEVLQEWREADPARVITCRAAGIEAAKLG